MVGTCRRAVELGLPAIAFTEHADFVRIHAGQAPLDLAGYLEAVEGCRRLFPGLKILSGVELGEPHRHPRQAAAVLKSAQLDRVLGSVHCLEIGGRLHDMSERGILTAAAAPGIFRLYLGEVLALATSSQPFEVLAHLDYPKRYWPHAERAFEAGEFEEEYRAILRALAARGSSLEINTTRGAEPRRGLCPDPIVLGWWREEGGEAIAFGSDTHEPSRLAAGFKLASQLAEAAGFRPAADPAAPWRR